MSEKSDPIYQQIRAALRQENRVNTVVSPQCPEPELLWEWVEQRDKHPEAARLLGHYITCASCRRQFAALCEIRALNSERTAEAGTHTALSPPLGNAVVKGETSQNDVRRLSRKVRAWVQELLDAGTLAPIASLRASMERMQHFSLASGSAVTRGATVPVGLRPAHTAIRSTQPNLRWTGVAAAQQYLVTIARPQAKTPPRPIWTGRVEGATELMLPHEARLKPGEVYLWEVIAVKGGQEHPSNPVAFLVLSEAQQRQLEVWEQQAADSPLARISVYEAYGLYEEALKEAEEWNRHEPDAAIERIQAELSHRLHIGATG